MKVKVNEAIQSKPLSPLVISFLSVFIGVVSGLGAVVFRGLIALFHNLLFLGKLSVVYNANVHSPRAHGVFLLFLCLCLAPLALSSLLKLRS
jgi:CIC family chloride channel protein